MTIGYKTTGFQFRLTNVTGLSFDANTQQNVKKRIENIVYLYKPPVDSIKLEYVGSTEINANTNIYIGDRSDELYENSRKGRIEEFISEKHPEGGVDVANNNFITTQIFKEAESKLIPLYYAYKIQADYASVIRESIRLYDKKFSPIGDDKYNIVLEQKYNEDTGAAISPAEYTDYYIMNNLKSYYNDTTGEYDIFFVQYTKVVDGKDITVTELLNNELAYHEAKFQDMWHSQGGNFIKPWVRAYTIDKINNIVSYPIRRPYAIKYEELKKIKVKAPIRTDSISPWFLRIANGSFVSGGGYKYSIPEFSEQAFNPVEPYKLAINVSCKKVDSTLLKLPHEQIKTGLLFSPLSIEIKKDGITQYAITNDVAKIDSDYLNLEGNRVYDSTGNIIKWRSDILLGIDALSGLVNLNINLLDAYKIYATYSYEELYYELNSLNMNPLFDSSASKEIRAIYLIPQSEFNNNIGTTEEGKQKASIHWVKVSSSGYITSTNQSDLGNNEKLNIDVTYKDTSGYYIKGIIGLHYNRRASGTTTSVQLVISSGSISLPSTSSFPIRGWIRFLDPLGKYRYAEYIDKTKTQLILSDDIPYTQSLSIGTMIELVNFVDERTTLTNRSFANEQGKYNGTPTVYSRYFLLAELSINPPHGKEDLVRIDVRENGGGVRKDKYNEAKLKQPEVQWYNDFNGFDGQIHPGNACLVIKLPATILNRFSEFQIEEIINENVPVGVKPIIRYYGYEPEIISVLPTQGSYGFGEGPFGDYPFGGE